MRQCISHHFACDCREADFKKLEEKFKLLKKAIEKIHKETAHVWEQRIAEDAIVQLERLGEKL